MASDSDTQQYVLAFTAGSNMPPAYYGAKSAAFLKAIQEATGRPATPLMSAYERDALIVLVPSTHPADIIGRAVMTRLRENKAFDFSENLTAPDRFIIFETAGQKFASNAVIKTAAGLR